MLYRYSSDGRSDESSEEFRRSAAQGGNGSTADSTTDSTSTSFESSPERHHNQNGRGRQMVVDVEKVKRQIRRHFVPESKNSSNSSNPNPFLNFRFFESLYRENSRHNKDSYQPAVFIVHLPASSQCRALFDSVTDGEFSEYELKHAYDDYFLERVENYAPLLQQMRENCGRDPLVFVTNWQNSETYTSDWLRRFKEVMTHSLHPTPIYIESFGRDDEIEDILMEIVKGFPPLLARQTLNQQNGSSQNNSVSNAHRHHTIGMNNSAHRNHAESDGEDTPFFGRRKGNVLRHTHMAIAGYRRAWTVLFALFALFLLYLVISFWTSAPAETDNLPLDQAQPQDGDAFI